jgi:hypothetical protein
LTTNTEEVINFTKFSDLTVHLRELLKSASYSENIELETILKKRQAEKHILIEIPIKAKIRITL